MFITCLLAQAQARCHRIGQSKAVKVYRLITRNSYEREMFDKASLKLGLDKAVLQDINRKGSLNGVSTSLAPALASQFNSVQFNVMDLYTEAPLANNIISQGFIVPRAFSLDAPI